MPVTSPRSFGFASGGGAGSSRLPLSATGKGLLKNRKWRARVPFESATTMCLPSLGLPMT